MSGTRGRGSCVLVIDVGTSAVKAALVDEALEPISVRTVAQHIATDTTGASEHVPSATWLAVGRAIRGVVRASPGRTPAAIAVTGPRGTFCVTDSSGLPRSPFLTWQDSRAAGEFASMASHLPRTYAAITGMGPAPSSVLPKLLWLQGQRPELFNEEWLVETPQGFVMRRLGTNFTVVDASSAAHIGLLDLATSEWSAHLLRALNVGAANLPVVVPAGAVVGTLSKAAASPFGLPVGIPIVAAGSDGICSELGAGVTEPGRLYAYLGTAGAVAGPVLPGTTAPEPGIYRMPGSIAGRQRLVGLALAGGSAAAWFMRTHGVGSFSQLEALVVHAPAGAAGALFVPTLAGAGLPRPDGRARGVFAGLSPGTTRGDLARAVLEGVAVELDSIARRIAPEADAGTPVALTGGGSRSDAWSQIVADVLGRPIARVRDPNPGLRGGAAYGFSALEGQSDALLTAQLHPPTTDAFLPNARAAGVYDGIREMTMAIREAFSGRGIDELIFAASGTEGMHSTRA